MTDIAWLQIRSKTADGDAGSSPDIILGGPEPDAAWTGGDDKTFGQSSSYTGNVYVYVRAKNAGSKLAVGTVTVWLVSLGDLPVQGKWVKLATSDGRGGATLGGNAGDVVATGTPLIWHPDGPPAPGAPYCLVAEITGDGHPSVPVPDTVKTRADFDAFVAQSRTMAYLVVQDAPVVETPKPAFSWALPIALGNAEAIQLGLGLTCTSGPAGGSLAYALDKPDGANDPIGVGKTPYTIDSIYSQTRTVDPDFAATVTVLFEPPGDSSVHAEFTFQVTTMPAGPAKPHQMQRQILVSRHTIVFGQTAAT